jgi:hypothetical protein
MIFIGIDKIMIKKAILIILIISLLYWPRIKILTKLPKTAYACVMMDKDVRV